MTHQLEEIFGNFGQNSGFVKDLYESYLTDRSLVSEKWAKFFDQLIDNSNQKKSTSLESSNGHASASVTISSPILVTAPEQLQNQAKVTELIAAYRDRGHLISNLSPITNCKIPRPEAEDLNIESLGFSDSEMQKDFFCSKLLGKDSMTLRDIATTLKDLYSNTLGVEFTHIHNIEERNWVQENIEFRNNQNYCLTQKQKIKALEHLLFAEHFEDELHKKYIGHKRFSLEGGETLVPMLRYLIENSGRAGIKEVVVGMAHRGRLNVLVNVLQKPLLDILTEFEDQSIYSSLGSGDVKYHLGYESIYTTENGDSLKLTLACNPSHLEVVNPVVEGICRAKQDRIYNEDRLSVLPLIIHGDAAAIGQGVVMETMNFSLVNGYETGGSVHVIVNNQIGFTTYPEESRSCPYSSEMMKAIQIPIFHVNSEDPEICCWAIRTALEYRQKFKKDAVVDLYCYRKYGHNEADDPSYTQPVMYSEIRKKEKISEIYSKTLISEGVINKENIDGMSDQYIQSFDSTFNTRKPNLVTEACSLHGRIYNTATNTTTPLPILKQIANRFRNFSNGFVAHPKLVKILETRIQTLDEGKGVDWAFGEALAFGALLLDGINVRLSGQDCIRGTFSQRHLGLRHYETGELYYPLKELSDKAKFEVYNSVLSEYGIMGFEFGFSSIAEKTLTMWEAQFGDFANGAQIIIDQFLAASEAKWGQLCSLVLLLPHGYEGQGPEHSSARLERFLQLCAEGNMSVCMPTNAGQYFHLLRRQGLSKLRRPLVIMTPKSLLRNPAAASEIKDLTQNVFFEILIGKGAEPAKAKSIIFTSGKVFYDLRNILLETKNEDILTIRIEELYPFPAKHIKEALAQSPKAKKFIWVQEEPENMGAWRYIDQKFRQEIGMTLKYFGRPEGASTAAGSNKRHIFEQTKLIKEA